MKEFLEGIAKRLVDSPDEVSIEIEEKEDRLIFKLKVAKDDIGKIIGRSGKTASALRVLLHAMGVRSGKRCVMEIVNASSKRSQPVPGELRT